MGNTEKNFSINTLITFCSLITVSAWVYLIHFVVHPKDMTSQILSYFDESLLPSFLPEPVEKLQYITSIILLPFLIITFHYLLKNLNIKARIHKLIFWASVAVIICFLFIGMYNVKYFSLSKFEFPLMVSLLSLILVMLYRSIKEETKMLSRIMILLSVSLSCYIAYMNVFSIRAIDNAWIYQVHFNAVYYSVAAVMYKHSLFVNLENQYGLYPEFLLPLFKITGLSVHKFTFVMSIMIALTFLSWFYMLFSNLERKWIAFIGFMTTVYFSYLFLHTEPAADSYFQYYPIRTIFPSILLVIATAYLKSKKQWLYYLGWILFPIGVLWNIETGVVTLVSWVAFLLYKECTDFNSSFWKRILKHTLIGFIFGVLIFMFYSIYIYLKSGHFPNFIAMTDYIKIFYNLGFYMLPMPILHPWNIIIFVYVIGLVISIRALLEKKYNLHNHMIFLLSILGFGLFSYYQGRSHDHVLSLACYPAFLLLAIYTDLLVRSKVKLHTYIGYILLFILTFSAISVCYVIPTYDKIFHKRVSLISSKERTPAIQHLEFILKHTKRGEAVTIFSNHAGVYYGETGTTPVLNIPGAAEMLLKKDYTILHDAVKSKQLDYIFFDIHYMDVYRNLIEPIVKTMQENYVQIDASEDKQMILYQKK